MKKNEISDKTDIRRSISRKALLYMFPSSASFSDFKENDGEIARQAIPAVIRYAFANNVISEDNESSFFEFLKQNTPKALNRQRPADHDFSSLLNVITRNYSVNTLITHLDNAARSLGFPPVSAPMITRLKQNFIVNTPKKRALLRLMAFWIAQNRPELTWDYDALVKMPSYENDPMRMFQEKAGVTMSFHLRGQGEMISFPDIAWLKDEIADCLNYLDLNAQIHKKMVETIGTASFSFRLLKQPGSPDDPVLYRQAIRSALAVAHQISARWLLCSYSNPRKRLIIMISAGPAFEDHRFDLQLPDNIPASDTGIYLSDFAHLCAEISNLKGFRRCFAGPSLKSAPWSNMWSLIYFWPNHHYDYIPCLLDEKMLPKFNTGHSYEEFQRALLFPESYAAGTFGVLEAMHRHPQHTLHFIEIAKVLRARQMPVESDEVIARVLLTEPDNLTARYIRLLAHGHLANSEPGIEASLPSFERGIAEGEYILRNFSPDTEILWAMGILHFNRAIKLLHHFWRNHPSSTETVHPEDVGVCLRKAADYFQQGLASSSSGQTDSCLFWLQYTLSFIELFSGKGKTVFNRQVAPGDDKNIFRQAGIRTLTTLGLMPVGFSQSSDEPVSDIDIGLKAALFIFSKNQNFMHGRSYIPYTQYMLAMILWDFAPKLTLSVGRIVRHLLEQARHNTIKLLKDNLCVYHVFSGFIPSDRYIRHVEQMIDLIKTFISDDDLTRGDDYPIHPAKAQKMSQIKLMLIEMDRL